MDYLNRFIQLRATILIIVKIKFNQILIKYKKFTFQAVKIKINRKCIFINLINRLNDKKLS